MYSILIRAPLHFLIVLMLLGDWQHSYSRGEWSFCLARVTDVRDENLWGGLSRGRWRLTKKHLHLAVAPPSSACLLMLVVICMPIHAHLSVLGVSSFPQKIFLILLCSNDESRNDPKSIFGWAITIVILVTLSLHWKDAGVFHTKITPKKARLKAIFKVTKM